MSVVQRIAVLAAAVSYCLAQEPKRPPITGIAHVAIYAHDVEKARAFYEGFLGFAEPFRLDKPDGSLSMAFIKVNDHQYIELSPETAPGTDRLNHISVETTDIEGMRRYLESKGVPVPASVGTGRIKNRNFNVKDPDGHTVEFVEYMPDGWSMRDKGKFLPERVSAKILHLGILVGSLDASINFYGGILGFQETWRGSKDGKTLNWVNMKVPDGDTYLEFMLYRQIPGPTARGVEHHICLEVADIEKAKSWLVARPGASGYDRLLEIRTGINRRRQLNLYDPDGTRSELMEPHTVDGQPVESSSAPPPR